MNYKKGEIKFIDYSPWKYLVYVMSDEFLHKKQIPAVKAMYYNIDDGVWTIEKDGIWTTDDPEILGELDLSNKEKNKIKKQSLIDLFGGKK